MERIDQLKQFLAGDPNDTFILFALAKELANAESHEESLTYFLRLKEQDPDYIGLYYHLGALYQEMEQPNKAIEIYQEGIQVGTLLKDLHAVSELKGVLLNLQLDL